MTLSFSVFFLLLAVILFCIAAAGVASGRFNLIAAGLAFFALSFLATQLTVQ